MLNVDGIMKLKTRWVKFDDIKNMKNENEMVRIIFRGDLFPNHPRKSDNKNMSGRLKVKSRYEIDFTLTCTTKCGSVQSHDVGVALIFYKMDRQFPA